MSISQTSLTSTKVPLNKQIACADSVADTRFIGKAEGKGKLIWSINEKLAKKGHVALAPPDSDNWVSPLSTYGLRYNVTTQQWSGKPKSHGGEREIVNLNSLNLTKEEKDFFKTMQNIAEKTTLNSSSNQNDFYLWSQQ